MSIATDQEVKNLRKEVESMKERISALEASSIKPQEGWIDEMREAYRRKFGKPPHHLLKTEGLMKALGITADQI